MSSKIPSECRNCDMWEHCSITCPTCAGESPEWPVKGPEARMCPTCRNAGRVFEDCRSSDCALAAADAKGDADDFAYDQYAEQQAGLL